MRIAAFERENIVYADGKYFPISFKSTVSHNRNTVLLRYE